MIGGAMADKVALVTGGSSGIGFGAAQRLLEEGAFVYITGRDREKLDRAAQALGANCRAIQADATKKQDMARVAEIIRAEKGQLHAVFCNAGGAGNRSIEETTEEFIDSVFAVNVKGQFFTVQSMLPVLVDGGSIILNASITIRMGLPNRAISAASKAAIRSFARSWTTDLAHRRIRVNALSPGVVPTEGYKKLGLTEEQIAAYNDDMAANIPLGRVGTPRDMGNAVVFLASDASSYITGIELVVDGGMTQINIPSPLPQPNG